MAAPNQNYNGLSGSPINYLTGGNPTNLIPGSQVLNSLGLGKRK